MVVTIHPITKDWKFWLGLLLRLLMIAAVAPWIQIHWFVPFLIQVPLNGLMPWSEFLSRGGDPISFPYGWTYLATFFPATWIGNFIAGGAGARVGIGLTIMMCDLCLYYLLVKLAGARYLQKLCLLYWLSPVVLYVGYWHGQLDVFPTALLVSSLLAAASHNYVRGGLIFGATVASKLSMILPAPFMMLHFLGRSRLRSSGYGFFAAAAAGIGLLLLPFSFSSAFQQMVFETPEAAKTFSFALPIGSDLNIYVLPMALLALLYAAWRIRLLDFEMLWTFTGVVFMAFLLLTPSSPGWVMWALPFVVAHVARSHLTAVVLYLVFSFSFVALHLHISPGAIVLARYDLALPLAPLFDGGSRVSSVLFTMVMASGTALAIQMFRRGVLETPFRAATQMPIVLGIGGDSGSGKDTLVEILSGMFGPGALAHISGDDYHIWDRHKPMWRALTHLNPKANDLDGFANNVRDLSGGRTVWARHYDHKSGRMTKPSRIAPAQIVAASGLHALWSPALNALYDVRIYLDMDEDLRRFLKLQRDVKVRGYPEHKVLENIESRRADAARFIHPQAQAADAVIRLEPRHRSALDDYSRPVSETPLRMIISVRPGEEFDRMVRHLVSRCGIQAIEQPQESGNTEILIEGEATAGDIAKVAELLAPELSELLAVNPRWESGLKGVLQLILLDQIARAARRRRVSV